MKPIARKRLTLVALGAAILLAVAYGFWPRPMPVDVAEAHRGPFQVTLEEEGRTRVRDHYVVSAPVAGYVGRIALDAGDPVEAGQPLARLAPLPADVPDARRRAASTARVRAAEAALAAASADARAAAASADLAEADLGRIRRLFDDGAATRHRLDEQEVVAQRAASAASAAASAVDVARFEVEAAQTALAYAGAADPAARIDLRAPAAGRVLRLHHRSEGVVPAGAPLVDLGDPERLEVVVDVLSSDAVRIQPGTRVCFDRWGGAAALEGRVRRIEPAGFTKVSALGVEEQRVLVVVDPDTTQPDWRRLGDAYRVIARFVLWEDDDVLQIPTSALFPDGDGWAVFQLDDGRARHRKVEVGRRGGLTTQITAGLDAGDRVVTHPDDLITDGARVRAR